MFECVYTTRKTQKVKRWCDGFIEKRGSCIRLFNEDRKSIHAFTSFAILEDSSIDTPAYLIFTDFLDELVGKAASGPDGTFKKLKAEPKLQGRSRNDVLDLFKANE